MSPRRARAVVSPPLAPASMSQLAASSSSLTTPGTTVGVRYGATGRWPLAHAHPACWETPLVGTVLAADDPAAWVGSLAFATTRGVPTAAAVAAHLAGLGARERGQGPHAALRDLTPVRWTHPVTGAAVIRWEATANLRPYADDLAAWEAARQAAFAAALRPGTRQPKGCPLTLVRAA